MSVSPVSAISAIHGLAEAVGDSSFPNAGSDAQAFEKVMAGATGAMPEMSLLGDASKLSVGFSKDLSAVPQAATAAGDPDRMLQAQLALFEGTTNVDVMSKMAGSVSQSVNKLLSMQ